MAAVDDGPDALGDRHLDADFGGQLAHDAGGADAFGHLVHSGQHLGRGPPGADLLADERNFIDLENSPMWFAEQHEIVPLD